MPFITTQRLTNKGAKTMMEAAIKESESVGIAATIAIVDSGGHMLLLERMDGGRFHTVHSSTTKAVTAASKCLTTQGQKGSVAFRIIWCPEVRFLGFPTLPSAAWNCCAMHFL